MLHILRELLNSHLRTNQSSPLNANTCTLTENTPIFDHWWSGGQLCHMSPHRPSRIHHHTVKVFVCPLSVQYIHIGVGSKIGVVRPGACEVNKHSSPGGRLLLCHSFHHLHDMVLFPDRIFRARRKNGSGELPIPFLFKCAGMLVHCSFQI